MKIRFAKGVFKLSRERKPKQEPLTTSQAARVQSLVASLTAAPKPTVKPKPTPAAATKVKPVAAKAKPSSGRAIVGRELDNLLSEAIREFCAAARHGAFLPGGAVRSLVR